MERTLMPLRTDATFRALRHRAFTLIELLVATAVFMVLLIICLQILNQSTSAVRVAERVSDTDQIASLVFELLNHDIECRVPLARAPREWAGVAGNDPLAFFTSRPGYDGDRGLSWVRYFVGDGSRAGLHRGAQGLFVDTADGQPLRVFNPGLLPAVSSANEVLISPQVFRMETAFMVRDSGGVRIESSPPVDAAGFVETGKVLAIVVTLAILDAKALPLLPATSSLATLATKFPDAPAGSNETLLARWHAIAQDAPALATDTSVPLPVAQGVRVFERIFYLQ
jgi:prepilin-type N-terminal cleavage/methylation domain-containing protein